MRRVLGSIERIVGLGRPTLAIVGFLVPIAVLVVHRHPGDEHWAVRSAQNLADQSVAAAFSDSQLSPQLATAVVE